MVEIELDEESGRGRVDGLGESREHGTRGIWGVPPGGAWICRWKKRMGGVWAG